MFAYDASLAMFRLESGAWDLPLGTFRMDMLGSRLSHENFHLRTFAWEFSLGASCLGSDAGGILVLRRGWPELEESGWPRRMASQTLRKKRKNLAGKPNQEKYSGQTPTEIVAPSYNFLNGPTPNLTVLL